MNNRGYISAETRLKVEKAIKKLKYQPNEIARSLFSKKTNILGLIVPSIIHPFFCEMIQHLEHEATKHRYKILLCNSNFESNKEQEYLEMLRRHKVDGIIIGSHTPEVLQYITKDCPLVTFDRRLGKNIPYITSDNSHGGQLAAELLIQKGCKNIACLAGNLELDLLSNERFESFINTVHKHNAHCHIIQTDANVFNFEKYVTMIEELFHTDDDVDGIFLSDMMAIDLLSYCFQNKIQIPKKLKVIGYDDIIYAKFTTPPLTTIKQSIEEMSIKAIEILDNMINGKKVQMQNVFPVEMILRGTT